MVDFSVQDTLWARILYNGAMVISLDEDRWVAMMRHVTDGHGIPIRRALGTDARTLGPDECRELMPHVLPGLRESPRLAGQTPMLPAQVGCALSHIRLWQALVARPDVPFVWIMEDDCRLTSDFRIVGRDFFRWMPSDWDIVLVGNQVRQPLPGISTEPSYCLHCYFIAQSGAKKLLEHAVERGLQPIDVLVHDAVARFPRSVIAYNWIRGPTESDKLTMNIHFARSTGLAFQSSDFVSLIDPSHPTLSLSSVDLSSVD